MCMIDEAGEHYEVYEHSRPRARRAYRCDECGAPIACGEGYERTTGLWEGSWDTWHTCQACADGPCAWLLSQCGGYLHGGVLEDLEEHRYEIHDPVEWIGLARLIIAMRRRRRLAAVRA